MSEVVRISVPVSREAAASLASEEQLQEVGQFVSALILRTPLLVFCFKRTLRAIC